MINFAAYLDVNQKSMQKSDDNMKKLDYENREKRKLIERQKAKIEILQQQKSQMKQEQDQVEIYHKFLADVRMQNSDEYSEISDILARYKTLKSSQFDLKKKQE